MPESHKVVPRVALRFDVDTYQCMHRGVPRLLELADEFQIPMTFFINMGRAVSYPGILRKLGNRRYPVETTAGVSAKISPVKKLGLRGTLYTLLANPRVGLSSQLFPEIQSRGHEIGLHGGRNHACWQNSAHTWAREHLNSELAWGLRALKDAGVSAPRSFASPGWNSPEALPAVLPQKEFTVLADHHNPEHNARLCSQSNDTIRFINTNLAGEPGGVGYLESCEARGLTFRDTNTDVRQALQRFADVVMYDHPAYAGGRGLARLQAIITALKQRNVQFLTLTEMAWGDLRERQFKQSV
mgnify:CR=1 FL=1